MKPFVAIDEVLDNLFFNCFRCISIDDCAQTEILVNGFGADSERAPRAACAQASNAQTPILVRSQSAIKMPAEVADFPLILSKVPS